MGKRAKSKGKPEESRGLRTAARRTSSSPGPWQRRLRQGLGWGDVGVQPGHQMENSEAGGHPQTHTNTRGSLCLLKPEQSQLAGQVQGLLASLSPFHLCKRQGFPPRFLILKVLQVAEGTTHWVAAFEWEK